MKEWLWYVGLKTLTYKQKKILLDIYREPQNILEVKKEELQNLKFLNESNINEILQKIDYKTMKKYEEYMKKSKIEMIHINDSRYPKKLKSIYNPPICLFLKGNITLLYEFSIAVIGCREASYYGLQVALEMSKDLAKEDIVIISGMARGIDSVAHSGALEVNGKTIAVLGSGVDCPYPFSNVNLYQEILSKNGLIISEYLVGTQPKPMFFPERNRIISGLSQGILVVEAKKKSGTMITVDFALEDGRNVYVIPGNINSIYSEGTNALIKQGAKLVSEVKDILEDYREFKFNIT